MTRDDKTSTERRFHGKAAIVTGAASGIGRATAMRLASDGANVVGVDVNADALAAAARDGGFLAHQTDIRSREACQQVVESVVTEFGRLDVLCNVAAVSTAVRSVEMTEQDWQRLFDVNVSGTWFMCQAAIPHVEETGGSIVNVASNAATQGLAYFAAYCATKGAVAQLTRALAIEYARSTIRINAVAPGGTDTPLNHKIATEIPEDADMDLLMRAAGWRPFSQPDELAAVIAWVASDEARPLHGAIIAADQGLTAG